MCLCAFITFDETYVGMWFILISDADKELTAFSVSEMYTVIGTLNGLKVTLKYNRNGALNFNKIDYGWKKCSFQVTLHILNFLALSQFFRTK